jgi:hypothetical protein
MFRMNGTPRAQDAHDCRDAGGRATQEQLPRSGDCVSFAQRISTCMGAEVAQYLSSGLAVNTSMYALARHPCRSRS